MKRIGILGGTFNPIHIGHLAMAQTALEKLKLDRVVFIPSYLPPHKTVRNAAAPIDRYQMVKLAISDNPDFDISDIEIKRGGKSYSVDTVTALCSKFPKTKWYFLIGGDSVSTLHRWRGIEQLLKMVKFVAVNRPGFKTEKSKIQVKSIVMPALEISSSYLRKCFSSTNCSAKYLIRPNVLDYIKKKKLYVSLRGTK